MSSAGIRSCLGGWSGSLEITSPKHLTRADRQIGMRRLLPDRSDRTAFWMFVEGVLFAAGLTLLSWYGAPLRY